MATDRRMSVGRAPDHIMGTGTTALPTETPNAYLLVRGSGSPESIDAYLYGNNGRVVTKTDGRDFLTVVAIFTTGGFGASAQADRLASGLYGPTVFETFEGAMVRFIEGRI